MEDYKPFVTKGFVSLIGDEISLQPIKILHDTGASKTLMLENSWPLSGKTSAVTRATRKKLEDNETLLQDDNTETSDVEVKDILFADVNNHFLAMTICLLFYIHGPKILSRYKYEDQKSHLEWWVMILVLNKK